VETKLKGELFHKGILRKEDDCFIIRQSIPYPLQENNAYLIESSNGWSVIDVGIDLPLTREVWEMALKEVGISFRQIRQIYITHCHPDHLGAARWLQQKCDAPVFMHREEIKRAREFIFIEEDFPAVYRRAIEAECNRHGFESRFLDGLILDWQTQVTPLFRAPRGIYPLDAGDEIDLAGEKYQIILAPGHADGQVMLFEPGSRRLFCADVLTENSYLHFSDWPNTFLENPLGDLFDSLDLMESLEVAKVYPGHGFCFTNLQEIMDTLREKHWRNLGKVLAAITEPVRSGDLYPQLFSKIYPIDYVHLHRLLLGETLGYMEYLFRRGRLQKTDDGDRVVFGGR
jgi:glyoxylase-like metal-dependent hydrolase (beta-lactamase superfamily II)